MVCCGMCLKVFVNWNRHATEDGHSPAAPVWTSFVGPREWTRHSRTDLLLLMLQSVYVHCNGTWRGHGLKTCSNCSRSTCAAGSTPLFTAVNGEGGWGCGGGWQLAIYPSERQIMGWMPWAKEASLDVAKCSTHPPHQVVSLQCRSNQRMPATPEDCALWLWSSVLCAKLSMSCLCLAQAVYLYPPVVWGVACGPRTLRLQQDMLDYADTDQGTLNSWKMTFSYGCTVVTAIPTEVPTCGDTTATVRTGVASEAFTGSPLPSASLTLSIPTALYEGGRITDLEVCCGPLSGGAGGGFISELRMVTFSPKTGVDPFESASTRI